MAKSQSTKKPNQPVVPKDKPMKDRKHAVMETYSCIGRNQTWQQTRPCVTCPGSTDSLKALVPVKPMPTPEQNAFPQFQSATRLAEWVFETAKHRPMQLNLCCSECSDEVRDALLRQFHRWPQVKISCAVEQYQTRCQEAEDQCQHQVKLYIEELRGKLLASAEALFWLDVLQPMIHRAPVPRQEARDILWLWLEELKSVDGVYELLMKKCEHSWDVLTLPLKLEPLFRSASTLALCGHEIAASEAMQILAMFVAQNARFPQQKKVIPAGLSMIASVGREISSLRDLPEAWCQQLSHLFFVLKDGWCVVVKDVLDVLEKSLASRWVSCERASVEQAFKTTVDHALQSHFARLRHVLATDRLYAMRKAGAVRSSTDEECLDVSISCCRGMLLVQLHGSDK